MEKEGGLVNRPPLLVGDSNYDYWKSRMTAFLKSIDNKTWKAVIKGWNHPVIVDKEGKSTLELKPEEDWSKEEDELALGNSKALNALYNGVDKHIFRLIKKCTSAKEAWEILKTVHEGTSKVKISRLQLLTTKFENLRMKDDESIHEFYMTILDYDNQFDALGEKISEERLVRKMLRSLPKKFDMKVTAIEDAKDISEMKLDELIGSLQTYEVAANERTEKKTKSIAFVSNAEVEEQQDEMESDESIYDAIVLLGKRFNKVLKRMDIRPRTNATDISRNINRNISNQRKPRTDDKPNQSKGVQCHECEGYGHIRTECATYLKKQKKGLSVSWSDEDDSEGEAETAKHINALTGVCTSDNESCDEELTYEELADSYKELCLKSEEVCRILEKQKKTIAQLQAERYDNLSKISELNKEVTELNSHLNNLKKHVVMLNKGTELLDEILENQASPGKAKAAIGYNYQHDNKPKDYNQDTKYIPLRQTFPTMYGIVSPHLSAETVKGQRQMLPHVSAHRQRKQKNT
ncbi:uncharacterized protein LOC123890825 [Trifolium pratense]|uniref:Uncharacterized protein n=2 Tax=Trifolium pratense TaxID=57577 RepID=A0ACB0J0F2_TRIPR|nr:uncharacterized protein LOC123890825 [Trifolium pratense]CAJ2633234.1 unnamed protein product [Trifolium pratense]CAJ2638376.1 unnamed protein product [Trifolium pratense]